MTKNQYVLSLSESVSAHGNLLIFAMSVKNFYKKGMYLEVTLPNKIISKLSKDDFNTFFTDILLDAKISDDNLNIIVTPNDHFVVKAN
jgi:hypothetical protein